MNIVIEDCHGECPCYCGETSSCQWLEHFEASLSNDRYTYDDHPCPDSGVRADCPILSGSKLIISHKTLYKYFLQVSAEELRINKLLNWLNERLK